MPKTIHRDRLGNSLEHRLTFQLVNDDTGDRQTVKLSDAEIGDRHRLIAALRRQGLQPPDWSADEHRDVVIAMFAATRCRPTTKTEGNRSHRRRRRRPRRGE